MGKASFPSTSWWSYYTEKQSWQAYKSAWYQKLKPVSRKKVISAVLQAKVLDLWEKFSSGEKSTSQLLKAISYINDPPKTA
jgi:hypothetical protein